MKDCATRERSFGKLTSYAQNYLNRTDAAFGLRSPSELAAHVRSLVDAHDRWRHGEAISLNAAENVLSAQARALLNSDMATRLTEGFPGDKDFPAHRQNRFVDEIEAAIIHMVRRLFEAKHVEWRPVSTSMANATVFFALTEPGDILLAQPESAGGNYSYNPSGPPRAARLDVRPLAFNSDTFEVDVERAVERILSDKPRLIVVGGSNVLFPYPVRELREAADKVGAILVYDAAHLALLIAHGMFQDPLAEGAHVLTFSSHKIMSGAIGGFILTNDDDIADKILNYSFPTFIQTRDQNKYAATAHALAEMCAFGEDYARQSVLNARALARALEGEGFDILSANRGYTESHQVFQMIDDKDGEAFEDLCQQANLLVSRAQRVQDRPAIRLTSQEITRRGMREEQMPQLANWLRRVIRDREDPAVIAREVKAFLQDFDTIEYSFDDIGRSELR